MNDPKPKQPSNPHRIVGEDIPRWLTAAFAVMGTLIAAGAAWLWMSRESRPPEARVISEAPIAQSAQPATPPIIATAPVTPPAAPADATKPAVADESQPVGATVPPAQPPVSGGDQARAAPSAQAAADAPPAQAVVESPAAPATPAPPKECPAPVAVPFKFDSATPAAADVTSHIEEFSKWLNEDPAAKVSVQGYADSVGWDQYNLLLSYRRAKAVVALLTKSGIPAQRIIIRAAGSHEPIEGIPADAAENRRATLQVVGIKDCPSIIR